MNAVSGLVDKVSSAISGIAKTVMDGLATVGRTIAETVSGIVKTVSEVIGAASKGIMDSISSIGRGVRELWDFIVGAFKDVAAKVGAGFETIGKTLMGFVNSVMQAGQWIREALYRLGQMIWESLPGWIRDTLTTIVTFLTKDLAVFITKTLPAFFDTVAKGLEDFSKDPLGWVKRNLIDPLADQLRKLAEWIWSLAPEWLKNALTAAYDFLTDKAPKFIDKVTETLEDLTRDPAGWIRKNVVDPVIDGMGKVMEKLWSLAPEWLRNALTTIHDFLTKTVPEFFTKKAPEFFDKAVEGLNAVKKSLEGFAGSVSKLPEWIRENIAKPIGEFLSDIGGKIRDALQLLASKIWESLPEWLKNALTSVYEFFTKTVPEAFGKVAEEFVNFFKDPKTWFMENVLPVFAVKIEEHKPYYSPSPQVIPLTYPSGYLVTTSLKWAFPIFADIEIFSDPFRWLMEKVIIPIKGWLEELGGKAWEGLSWLWSTLVSSTKNIVETVWEKVSDFASWLWGSVTNTFKTLGQKLLGGVLQIIEEIGSALAEATSKMVAGLLKIAGSAADMIGKALTGMAAYVFTPIYEAFTNQFIKQTVSLAEAFTKATPPEEEAEYFFKGTGLILGEVLGAHYLGFGLSQILHMFASYCDELRPIPQALLEGEGGCALEPLGLGVRLRNLLGFMLTLGWHIKPSYVFREMAKDARELSDTFTRGLLYGLTIWCTNPLVRLINVAFRDALVIEMPTVDMMEEIVRRQMPTEKFNEVLENYRTILKLYGYRTSIIEWLTSTEMKITVKDRFDVERTIPLSLMYQLPSASDVARMAIRDIFGMGRTAIEAFLKVYSARGMHEDIGILYYLLHYRYPPPERLWTFVTRGFSGMLWATIPKEMMDSIQAEASRLKAPIPTPSSYWNFKAKELFTALQTYMTWHDYFRASWIRKEMFGWSENFTSDNQIMIDTLADIPTKIDQRWMIKWGIYELLSMKGVKYDSPVRDFALKVLENAPISEVKMDLTNFSRTLQATGLHPDWIPVTALAETMNVLSEERTLLRTGFINLFKEGFYDVKSLETLLAGFVKASFQVAYFDMDKMLWTTGWVNIPVMYLPPERKLLELRALMDRALDILREIQRDISTAYQEYIIWDYNEYKAKLTEVINNINVFYAEDYENITGVGLPEALKLRFVEEYYKPYVEALRIWRDIFTIRRVRAWTMRWLGWVMYRVAYGVVKREDVEKLITHVSSKAKLTDYEKEFIHNVLDIMYGMAASEYLPTPSTLATLSEYITLDPKLVGKVFEERRVPEEWRNIWLTYISVRPVKADAKSLLSTYVRALRQGVVSKEDVDKYVKELPQYGFTPREIEFIMRSVDLEEQIIEARENKREYIPTPSMIASMLEYVSIPAAQIQKVFEARKIPEEWRSIWMQYYLVRPIADDARILANAYYRAKRLQIPLGDVEKQILEILKASGMTPQELSIRDLATQIEVVIDEYLENRREYIPTPSMLASMSEYITIPEQVIQQVFTARRIPSEWQQIWRQYISVRPLVDDIRGLLTSYRRAMLYVAIPEEVKKRVEEYAKTINFTQAEWDVLTLRIMLEELILESREYIPTPLTLASICEYLPEARRFFEDVVKARRIPERWRELWARYVDIKPLVDDVKRYVSRAEALYVRFMTKKDDFEKILQEASRYLGYTSKEIEFLMKVTEFERYRNAWTELIGSVERLVELSEYSPKAANYALGKLKAMIDALPLTAEEKNELKAMWEEYIKNRPVKSEAKTYLTQLINAYVEGLITDITFKKELYEMKNWGFSDNELMFYEAQAALRKARKWKIPIGE
jgi:phage-related protein